MGALFVARRSDPHHLAPIDTPLQAALPDLLGCTCPACRELRHACPKLKQPSWVWLIGWITADAQADALIRDLAMDEEALPKKERRKRARARDKAARTGRQKLLAQLHGSYTANRRVA